jgi:hypothetical protein
MVGFRSGEFRLADVYNYHYRYSASANRRHNLLNVLIASSSDFQQLVDDLKETLLIFSECEIGCLSGETGASILTEQIINATEDYLILWNFDQWDKNNWYQFDCMRSALMKKRGQCHPLKLFTYFYTT